MNKSTNEDLVLRHPDTVVVTTVDTLKRAFKQWTAEQEQQHRLEAEEVMLGEPEVSARLHKSHATLWRWNQSGYLRCHKAGGRNVWRQSDVERIEKSMIH